MRPPVAAHTRPGRHASRPGAVRVALISVTILLAVAVLLVLGAFVYLRTSHPAYSGERTLAGLEAPVTVTRDDLGIPHVAAGNPRDLFRTLGYLHAQDRLWQMELFRRTVDGRLAEVLGPDLVDADRFLRTVGLGRAAAAMIPTLDPEERELLEAYAAGVNAWLDGHRGALPPEFVVLRHRPEPWEPRHSLGISKLLAWDLASFAIGLDLQNAIDVVGPELGRELLPHYPEWGEVILGPEATWRGGGSRRREPGEPREGERRIAVLGMPLPGVPAAVVPFLEAASAAHASNSWVVSGALTRSGKPILANDPHLAYRAPGLWYPAALEGGDLAAAGVTVPGIPAVVLGRTRSVAWAWTNAMVEDVDFFVERLDSAGARYLTSEGWRDLELHPEVIGVRGGEPVAHTVRSTRHGPIISDVEGRAGDRVLSMRWTALEPTTEMRALLEMYRARDVVEFDRAVRLLNNVHQNVLFADTAGRIGYRMAGRVPVRRGGDGLLPVPGWTGEADWLRYLDPEELPAVLDPSEGFIATANERVIGTEYPFHLANLWAGPYRGTRIRELLRGARGLTAEAVARQQMDVRDLHALRYRSHAVRAAERAGETEAARLLADWDGEAGVGSRAAALFYTWYEALRRAIAQDEFGEHPIYFPRSTLDRILETGGSPWVNDLRTDTVETLEGLAARAMAEAVETVGRRGWGELHVVRMDHALGRARLLERALGLNVGPGAIGGSPHTVNVAGYANRGPPFVTTHGASMRHVVDLADPESGAFVIPTGQSGIPTFRHYRDQHAHWREGRLRALPLDRARLEPRIRHRLTLRPASAGPGD
jgi:penicillin G amidase